MKNIILLTLVFSFSSFAKTTIFTCEFPSISKQGNIQVAVKDIHDANKIELHDGLGVNYEGEDVAYTYTGEVKLEWLWGQLLSWDGYSVSLDNKGDMEFSIDSDGCDYGSLKLYKKTGYRLGQLFIEHHCSGKVAPTTSKVYCSLN